MQLSNTVDRLTQRIADMQSEKDRQRLFQKLEFDGMSIYGIRLASSNNGSDSTVPAIKVLNISGNRMSQFSDSALMMLEELYMGNSGLIQRECTHAQPLKVIRSQI